MENLFQILLTVNSSLFYRLVKKILENIQLGDGKLGQKIGVNTILNAICTDRK